MLEWLSKVKCEDHHAEVVKARLEGTGAWLLQRQEIRHWLELEESSVLWLHGKGNVQDISVFAAFARTRADFCVSSRIGKDSAQVSISFHNYDAKCF